MINASVSVIALHEKGRVAKETYEAVDFARELSKDRPGIVVLSGEEEAERVSRELAEKTGLDVVCLSGSMLGEYSAEAYRKTLLSFFRNKGDVCICIPHTSEGSDFAPQLSVGLKACCITSVEGIGEGVFFRSMFGGKFRAEIRPERNSLVLTVIPGASRQQVGVPDLPGAVKVIPLADMAVSTRTQGFREAEHADMALAKAEVIVSAGRGIGRPENLSLIEKLSSLFPKSAIGATRGVCDLGWLGYTHQIGSTGNTVAPKLYLACGISGAIQHVAGMKDSQLIVAINTDVHAAIFRTAHYCIVEDLSTFIPLLIDIHLKRGG
ncbi:MAG TPA: electron transfer flavoprotein subunit alpha/FixB family protein [Deltaproteobacteria bacterium]|jgi:electron transfer flavoprotein alpha subunit|nr:electron transfer flavoprotein subunit alpha/FixB family protein [Deltaproteobacteria bacterium]HQI02566.1 electron transfer flavoprotein subunit alpha/FixB family protein [Deltaproteobacteria bacterium]